MEEDEDVIILSDDEEVMRYLRLHDLLNPLKSAEGENQLQNQASIHFSHEDESGEYECLATYHWGQVQREENGYTMIMLKNETWNGAAVRFGKFLLNFGNLSHTHYTKPNVEGNN